jgi:cytoskeleton protein RodZ
VPEAHESVGAFLRWGREARGERLDEVARTLRIRPAYLEAIEAGRWGELPGKPYATGFVRSYADHLGADVEGVTARLRDEIAGFGDGLPLEFPEPISETRIPANAITAVCVCLSLVLYSIWYYQSSDDMLHRNLESFAERDGVQWPEPALRPFPDAEAPRGLVTLDPQRAYPEPAPGQRAGPRPEPGTAGDVASLPRPPDLAAQLPVPQLEPLPGLTVRTESSRVAHAAQFPSLPPDLQSVGRSTGPAQAASLPREAYEQRRLDAEIRRQREHGIVLHARRESWVEVRSERNGAVVFTKLLREGEYWQVPEEDGLKLTTGNAGGLDILIDGAAAPALGPLGAVRRDIPLDRAQLLAGSRPGG